MSPKLQPRPDKDLIEEEEEEEETALLCETSVRNRHDYVDSELASYCWNTGRSKFNWGRLYSVT